jgi:hypothetical protein
MKRPKPIRFFDLVVEWGTILQPKTINYKARYLMFISTHIFITSFT